MINTEIVQLIKTARTEMHDDFLRKTMCPVHIKEKDDQDKGSVRIPSGGLFATHSTVGFSL